MSEPEVPEVLDTEPVEDPQPRKVEFSPPVFEFVCSVVSIAEGIGATRVMQLVAQIGAMQKDLRSAVQRKALPDVIRACIGISAMCLLVFLAATPHYHAVEPEGDKVEGPDQSAHEAV